MNAELTAALRRAYRMTRYSVGDITIRIGRRSAALDRLLLSHRQREAAFITAFNPFSRRKPPGWNRRMQARLLQAARRQPWFPACGRWRRWSESHLLVMGPPRKAEVLARRYRQHGIVILRVGQPARLVYT